MPVCHAEQLRPLGVADATGLFLRTGDAQVPSPAPVSFLGARLLTLKSRLGGAREG